GDLPYNRNDDPASIIRNDRPGCTPGDRSLAAVSESESQSSRRPRADARRNRARVLEAAEEVFASHGLAVPIDGIARRAGVGAAPVYRHFPTKESLFEAVVIRRFELLTDEARSLAGALDPGAAFFGSLQRLVEEMATKRDLRDVLLDAGV